MKRILTIFCLALLIMPVYARNLRAKKSPETVTPDTLSNAQYMQMNVSVEYTDGTLHIYPKYNYSKCRIILINIGTKKECHEMADLSEGEVAFELNLAPGIYTVQVFDETNKLSTAILVRQNRQK